MARGRYLLLGVAAVALSFAWWALQAFSSLFSSPGWVPTFSSSHNAARWAFVKRPAHLFVFGDSYSHEGWDWRKANHPLDPYPIQTNSDGPVWARDLTRRWAPTTTMINLSVDGATVDNEIIRDPMGRVDLQWQISQFTRFFVNSSDSRLDWDGTNTVASLAFGTNDVALSYSWMSEFLVIETYVNAARAYIRALDALRDAGISAFVFSQVLPLDRAGIGLSLNEDKRAMLRGSVRAFNDIVVRRGLRGWCSKHDVLCIELKTFDLANRVMDNPSKYGFTQPHEWCAVYGGRRNAEPDLDAHPSCKGPLREYVWRDYAHPSYAFHELWADLYADAAAKALRGR